MKAGKTQTEMMMDGKTTQQPRHDGLNKCEHGTALHSALDIQSVSLHEPIGQAIMAYRQNYTV